MKLNFNVLPMILCVTHALKLSFNVLPMVICKSCLAVHRSGTTALGKVAAHRENETPMILYPVVL